MLVSVFAVVVYSFLYPNTSRGRHLTAGFFRHDLRTEEVMTEIYHGLHFMP